jgi:hypothetical protein
MVYPLQKIFFAGVRVLGEYGCGMLGHIDLTRLARPTAHIAIRQQGQSPQLVTPTCVLQVGQKIVKAQLEAK